MSLVTDSLTAGGTLLVAVGSGLQAFSELVRYKALLRKLGLTNALDAYLGLFPASMRHITWRGILLPPFYNPWKWVIWHPVKNTNAYIGAVKNYWRSVNAIGVAKLSDIEKIEVRALYLKANYWALIMFGSAAIFVAACMVIYSDLKS